MKYSCVFIFFPSYMCWNCKSFIWNIWISTYFGDDDDIKKLEVERVLSLVISFCLILIFCVLGYWNLCLSANSKVISFSILRGLIELIIFCSNFSYICYSFRPDLYYIYSIRLKALALFVVLYYNVEESFGTDWSALPNFMAQRKQKGKWRRNEIWRSM